MTARPLLEPPIQPRRLAPRSKAERPTLPALQRRETRQLLDDHTVLVNELVAGLGSPLHLLLPQVFDDTVRQFRAALADAQVDGLILFAKKANKARCFVERCAALGIGVDTASAPELERALGAGLGGEHIGVSGPSKTAPLLELALRQGCWIAIDSPEELIHVSLLAVRVGSRARVLLRCRPDALGQTHSRFGMTAVERAQALRLCIADPAHVKLEGFAFHLTGYSTTERAAMAHQMVELCLEARRAGLDCRAIDIGGGFAVRYVAPADWERFLDARAPDDFHAGKAFSDFYPYGSVSAGAAMLAEILAAPVSGASSLGEELRQHGIRLLLEPGRALLDQAGVTGFRVQGVKDRQLSEQYAILTTEGTSFSLSEQWFNSEYLPDPILLGGKSARPGETFSACVGGASCLDSDMLTWRKVPFPRRVKVGDILIYANTAGYQMDSNESPFHDTPLPRKVVMRIEGGRARWRLDDVSDWHASPIPAPIQGATE
jgi:diaminopimelate decarboxylase